MDNPPVNALTVAGWFELADIVTRRSGEDPAVRVVVLRAEGRGFNAGVDIKEMQDTEGFDALIGANRGCYAAFAAVYECAVPVIAAVNGFCLGGGIGLVGNADVIVAERRRHLRPARGRPRRARRGHPPRPARAPAQDAGDGLHVAPPPPPPSCTTSARCCRSSRATELRDAALEVAGQIAAKSPTVIRAAKESLNGIDLVGREALVPLRAGLHLRAQPVGRGRRAPRRVRREARHRHVETGVTAREPTSADRGRRRRASCATGMTIGIGGWGSRRKPMCSCARSPAPTLARPHRRQLRRARRRPAVRGGQGASKVVYAFVSLDSIPLEPHFRAARQTGAVDARARRGHVPPRAAGRGVAGAVPADPRRARLRPRRPPTRDPAR